jgi:hypothetical protein
MPYLHTMGTMCSAARGVQCPGADFGGGGAENNDDAKGIQYATKSGKSWRLSKIYALPSHFCGLYCCSDVVAVVSGRVVFVARSVDSKQRGDRGNKRLKPIEFFCGCWSPKSRPSLIVDCNTKVRPPCDSTFSKRTYDVGDTVLHMQ